MINDLTSKNYAKIAKLHRSPSTELMKQAFQGLMESHGLNPVYNFDDVVANNTLYEHLVSSFKEGLSEEDSLIYDMLAEQGRAQILKEATYSGGIKPYAQFMLPLLRKYWPKLVAREVVTVMPIDKQEVMLSFLKPKATDFAGGTYPLPDYSGNVSSGAAIPQTPLIPNGITNLFATLGLTPDTATLDRNFKIIMVQDSAGNTTDVDIVPDENGFFHFEVDVNGNVTQVSGAINYLTGALTIQAANTNVANQYKIQANISSETNMYNTFVDIDFEKILLKARTRTLSARWSVELEQDVSNLFDLDAQGEFLDYLTKQITQDIDKEILNDLINEGLKHGGGAVRTFIASTPQGNFAWGPKKWYENMVTEIAAISNIILADTNIGAGNVIVCHPMEASYLQSTGKFIYINDGNNAELSTYTIGNLDQKQWSVFVTPNQPQGEITVALKPQELRAAVYVYAPYIPVTIIPFPYGNNPTITLKSRYAKKAIRTEGVGLLHVT